MSILHTKLQYNYPCKYLKFFYSPSTTSIVTGNSWLLEVIVRNVVNLIGIRTSKYGMRVERLGWMMNMMMDYIVTGLRYFFRQANRRRSKAYKNYEVVKLKLEKK